MNMIKETYERPIVDVTELARADVLTSSAPGGDTPSSTPPQFVENPWELSLIM